MTKERRQNRKMKVNWRKDGKLISEWLLFTKYRSNNAVFGYTDEPIGLLAICSTSI